MLYPWQQHTWNSLTIDLARLHHALLLHGPAGGGKADFGEALAARLLCETAQGSNPACGHCEACHWLAMGNHPDFRRVVPDAEAEESGSGEEAESGGKEKKASLQIRIEQIRDLAGFVAVATHRGGRRVVLLRPAEAMNGPTANALLKLLEEPTPGTSFILVSDKASALLPTIRSRCRQVPMPKPPAEQALAWLAPQLGPGAQDALALSGGLPLAALAGQARQVRHQRFLSALAAPSQLNFLALAGELEGWVKPPKGAEVGGVTLDMGVLVDWLQKWLHDLALSKQGLPPRFHPGQDAKLDKLARSTALAPLFACYNDLLRAKAVARHPLNSRLFIEDMLLRYVRLFGA